MGTCPNRHAPFIVLYFQYRSGYLKIFAANWMPTNPAMAVVKTTNNRPPALANIINPLA